MTAINAGRDSGQRGNAATPQAELAMYHCPPAQQLIGLTGRLYPQHPGLNLAICRRLDGQLPNAALEHAWRLLVERHAALRTGCISTGAEPCAFVAPTPAWSIALHDLSALPEVSAMLEAERLCGADARRPFDLMRAPLFRVSRIVLSETSSIVIFTAHQAICDGPRRDC